MFSIDVLINRIASETGYTTLPARPLDSNQQDPSELPIIYIGYKGIHHNPKEPIEYAFLNQHGEDLIQVFEVKIVTDIENLVQVWRQVYTSLNGYTPILSNTSTAAVSGFSFIVGDTEEANGKLLDVSKWAIEFPTTNVLL